MKFDGLDIVSCPGLDEILLNPKIGGLVLVCVERWHLISDGRGIACFQTALTVLGTVFACLFVTFKVLAMFLQ